MTFIILVINDGNKPVEIVAGSVESLIGIVFFLSSNSLTEYKVFSCAEQLMPEKFGWASLRGWVFEFAHESTKKG